MSGRVSFTDIYIDQKIIDGAVDVLESTRYVKGERVETFERRFADACGVDHAVGVASGTAAIYLSLDAMGIGPGDQVFVPGHTFFATVSPVLKLGATPVFVDVDPETYLMDIGDLEAKVRAADNPRAVIPVHIYGQMVDLDALGCVADDYDLRIVEDACQAHFAERDGRIAGATGDVGAFSFYPSKNMTVGGDGGMIVTDDDEIATLVRALRNHGRDEEGVHRELGLNFRLDEIKGAVGLEQLKRIDDWNEGRRRAARRYDERLAETPEVTVPTVVEGAEHVYHLYVVQVPDRDGFREYLDERGIDTGIHYPTPAHEHPAVVKRVGEVQLERTEALSGRIVSLPMHPRLSTADVDHVCDTIEEYYT